jgi:hypothetical protein
MIDKHQSVTGPGKKQGFAQIVALSGCFILNGWLWGRYYDPDGGLSAWLQTAAMSVAVIATIAVGLQRYQRRFAK